MSVGRISVLKVLVVLLMPAVVFAADSKRPTYDGIEYSQPQHMVMVEPGRRLNLYCAGTGSPTVIFDSGLGGGSEEWAPIQSTIAAMTRACSYDRAGIKFSDPGTRPGSSANIVDDLHRLLAAADIKPPYLLVGHSYGGLNVRLFADTYRSEIVGMVLVDPSHEDASERYRRLDPKRPTTEEWAKKTGAGAERARKCAAAASTGFVEGSEMYKSCGIGEPDSHFGDAINAVFDRVSLTPGFWLALLGEKESVYGASADQVRAAKRAYGDLPLIVLTASPPPRKGPESQQLSDARNQLWMDLHDEIAALSTRGVNRLVPGSGHAIQFDQPKIVADAVLEVLETARESRRGSVNAELASIVKADQADREPGKTDWNAVRTRDAERLARVKAIIAAGWLKSADDHFHAALVLQHGSQPADFAQANQLASKAAELKPDMRSAHWLAAASMDRWLWHTGKPQIYGTQFKRSGAWTLEPFDRTVVTDAEREAKGVPSIAQTLEQLKAMNAEASTD